ncbi:MAG: chain length-determining protein [Rhodocyclaceae bacterium]|nr:chain length-determining protein [Rhodocyclaceae bacterium]MBX3667651.1 chain length-determining protein [Rhodocyclaceae bacterium]
MEDLIRRALTYLRGMWLHRWWGVVVAWLVAIVGAVGVMLIPDKYEASARVFVDTQSVLKPLMAGLAAQPNVEQQITMLSRTLISRPNLEKVIRMADLDLEIKSREQRDLLIDTLAARLAVKGTGRDNLYTISMRDDKPQKAQRIVQALVSIFVESGIGDKRKDSDTARKFIEEQIRGYEARLVDAEEKLKAFKLKYLGTLGDKDYFTRLGEAQSAFNQAKLELQEAETSRDSLKRQVVGEDPVLLPDNSATPAAPVAANVAIPEIDGRIEALRKQLDALLQRYTDEHPDVIGTKRVIADLEQQKKERIAAMPKASAAVSSPSVLTNPVYQQLRVSLADAEARTASLRARVAEFDARVQALKSRARQQPEIEAEFTQLNRDYDVNKRNYELLVARRESATLSGEMDATAGVAEFRLIDPPRVSPKPVAPKRLLLLLGVLAGALAAGAGATFVLSQVRPVFHDLSGLREVTGLPVLGGVSMLMTEERLRQRRRGLFRLLSALALLVGAYGSGLALLVLTGRMG